MWLVNYALGGMDDVELSCAHSVEQMCAECRRMLFDMVIVLSVEPFFGGRDIVSMVRPRQIAHPVVYVISWSQSEQTVLSLIECGVDQYMTFPISLQRLRSKVANELNRRV